MAKKNKEKKPNTIVQGFDRYKFILKIFATLILVAFAIVIFIQQDQAIFAMLLITGGVTVLSALCRLVLLLKKGKAKESKLITAGEALLHIALGGYLLAAAFLYLDDPSSDFSKFNNSYYLLFLAAILYSRAIVYFWQAIIYKAQTTKFMFWLHVVFVTIAVLFAAFMDKIDAKVIVIILGVIAILCALLIGGEAGGGYYRYRKSLAPKKQEEKEKEEKTEIEAPAKDDDVVIEEIDPNIIPVNDGDQDSSIVS